MKTFKKTQVESFSNQSTLNIHTRHFKNTKNAISKILNDTHMGILPPSPENPVNWQQKKNGYHWLLNEIF